MTRIKYATPTMVERAAQECNIEASEAAAHPSTSGIGRVVCQLARDAVYALPVPDRIDDIAERWAEAEARLREGRMPDGWVLCCPCGGRLSHGRCCRCNRHPSVIATAWAPGKGPHQ